MVRTQDMGKQRNRKGSVRFIGKMSHTHITRKKQEQTSEEIIGVMEQPLPRKCPVKTSMIPQKK